MIKGLGNDIIEINRIEKAIVRYGQKFLDRLFSKQEQAYCLKHQKSFRHFAGRFAAKEAIVKALGTGFSGEITWLDIEVINDSLGKPVVHFSKKLQSIYPGTEVLISISHGHDYATAVAIIQ